MLDFSEILDQWDWRPIPGCPGRYALPRSNQSPTDVTDTFCRVERYDVTPARDPVHVVRLGGGGLISYEQADGTFVHTLGDADAFERKLRELGIPVAS